MRGRDRRWMQARAVYDGDEEVTSKFLSPGHLLFIKSYNCKTVRWKDRRWMQARAVYDVDE